MSSVKAWSAARVADGRRVLGRPLVVAGILGACCYLALRAWAVSRATAGTFGDSSVYLHLKALALWDPALWSGDAPPGAGIVYKVLPLARLAGAQSALVALCWLVLAVTVARTLRSTVMRVVGFAAVLAFSLVFFVVEWDYDLLTEPLSLGLAALVGAAAIELARCPDRRRIAFYLVVGALFAYTRDTNAYELVLLTLPLVVVVWRAGRRHASVVLLAVVILLFSGSYAGAQVNGRWYGPLFSVVVNRVLTDPVAERYFAAHGMPDGPAIRALAGTRETFTNADVRGRPHYFLSWFFEQPDLVVFRLWIAEHGQTTYESYLLSHPGYAIGRPWHDRMRLLVPDVAHYAAPGTRKVLPAALDSFLWPRSGIANFAWALAAAVLLAAAAALRRLPRALVAVGTLVVANALIGLLVWHGDSGEVDRHALLTATWVHLGFLLVALYGLDAVADAAAVRLRARGGVRASSSTRS